MCRNIRTLYNFEPPAAEDEVRAASLQYVRKISGFTKPSQANAEAFERAVDDVAAISTQLLGELVTNAPAKDREVEAAKARAPQRGGATPRSPGRPPGRPTLLNVRRPARELDDGGHGHLAESRRLEQ